jgi:hypothetical protein
MAECFSCSLKALHGGLTKKYCVFNMIFSNVTFFIIKNLTWIWIHQKAWTRTYWSLHFSAISTKDRTFSNVVPQKDLMRLSLYIILVFRQGWMALLLASSCLPPFQILIGRPSFLIFTLNQKTYSIAVGRVADP